MYLHTFKKATIGRLFEPRTALTNTLVYEAMFEIFGTHRNTLIGVNDINNENEWAYSSSSAQPVAFDKPWNIGKYCILPNKHTTPNNYSP